MENNKQAAVGKAIRIPQKKKVGEGHNKKDLVESRRVVIKKSWKVKRREERVCR